MLQNGDEQISVSESAYRIFSRDQADKHLYRTDRNGGDRKGKGSRFKVEEKNYSPAIYLLILHHLKRPFHLLNIQLRRNIEKPLVRLMCMMYSERLFDQLEKVH